MVSVLVFLLSSASAFAAGPALVAEPIIDMHCHIGCIGVGGSGCYIAPAMRKTLKFWLYQQAMGLTEGDLEKNGDEVVFKRVSDLLRESKLVQGAVILALDGVITGGELDREKTQLYVPSEFVAKGVAKYDNLFLGASINPYRKDALERLQWAADQGTVLIKWIPQAMDIDPADPRLIPFYRKLVELKLPLLSHVGDENAFMHVKQEYGDPMRLELALKTGVTVIAPHVASAGSKDGQPLYERLLLMLRKYPNLYVDNSATTEYYRAKWLDKAVDEPLMLERMLYGTDWPLQFFPLVSPAYFPSRISIGKMLEISGIRSAWDHDVETKKAAGVPASVFTRANSLLKLKKGAWAK